MTGAPVVRGWRQGDVLIITVDSPSPVGSVFSPRDNGRVVLARRGDHRARHALLEEHVREEHDLIVLPPGICRAQQPVYTPWVLARAAG